MTIDQETIAVYDAMSHDYLRRAADRVEDGFADFIAHLPQEALVLDLGCGTGNSSLHFLNAGFRVDATDATPAMVSRAQEAGVPARLARFDELDAVATYDGIWASYSLLHVPRADMPANLTRISRALKPGGWLHLGLKMGEGEHRDRLGRLYTYYGEDELDSLLTDGGFAPGDREISRGTGLDGTDYAGIWVHAQKPQEVGP